MSNCEACEHWTIRRVTKYTDGSEIQNWCAPDGKGMCAKLDIETTADFGCNRFLESLGDHIEVTHKNGAPHQHFKMIPCPDCNGKGDGGRGHRCAGTGLVRQYDDGYIGDEQTRTHPKEKEIAAPPKCVGCGGEVNLDWAHCPKCGTKLWKVAETEVVTDALAGLPPLEPPAVDGKKVAAAFHEMKDAILGGASVAEAIARANEVTRR